MEKITIKGHLLRFLHHCEKNNRIFHTSDIHNLSKRGENLFGFRLGSPTTYERMWRKVRENGDVVAIEKKIGNKRESTWEITGLFVEVT